jgi:hypothetical protein
MGFSLFRKPQTRPDNMLPPGWQFYSRPSNLEPPGTVFRIDGEKRRYIVERLTPTVDLGPEPAASKVEVIETQINILARLMGIQNTNVEAGGGKSKTLEFEIIEPERQTTTDRNMEVVLKPFLNTLGVRPDNRYYVIREARSATAMTYRLTSAQFAELGAETAVSAAVEAGVKLESKGQNVYEVRQKFPERLAVMFLPEEIAPVRAGLGPGASELGRIPVTGILEWRDAALTGK